MTNAVNVKVAVRCRPLNTKERQIEAQCVFEFESENQLLMRDKVNPENRDAQRSFGFDHVYSPECTQAQVYHDIGKPIVDQAIKGYNGTIFAYGQTGSGKTHSMMGSGDDIGVIPLMNRDIFARVSELEAQGHQFLLTVSYLEIYNEVIKDLLNPSDKLLKIREHPDLGIYVDSLAELVVRSAQDVEKLIQQGNKVRQVAATQMNERSSRSHSCFTIKIASKTTEEVGEIQREVTMNAKINLVDLAGSERASKTGATGDRLKEGAAINKSLSALGNVINMLADPTKKGHVPYRDSKLTRLLQESLGGNSLTVMIAAISPADYNYDETLSTLQYAVRAKSIKNETKKNETVNEKLIRELREEIERLRKLVEGRSDEDTAAPDEPANTEEMTKMEEMIANLERAKQQSWEEKERLAKLYEQERQKALSNDTNVLAFMQTVKQEKVEAIKRIRDIQQKKASLSKTYRLTKERYGATKSKLQKDMTTYQDLLQEEEQSSHHDPQREHQLQVLLQAIEDTRQSLVTDRDALQTLKAQQEAYENQLIEERAEMATQASVLEQNDTLRKAIQEEERSKLEQVKEEFLNNALREERERIANVQPNEALEVELAKALEKQKEQRHKFNTKLKQAHKDHVQNHRKTKRTIQLHLEEIVATYEAERTEMEKKYHQAILMLQQAYEDLEYVTKENAQLREELLEASKWEPT